ncbi:hypothetical protein BDN67DRAFT_1011561 [Paxillus ammoniavirescens]|nr:hypothetical protein BDN67DRAFT_1011561 [Paxillus ammoniavirescens]
MPIIPLHRDLSDSTTHLLSPHSELSGALGSNLSRQGPSRPGSLQQLGSVEYGLHGWHANQEQQVQVGDISNNPPFFAPTNLSPATGNQQQQPVPPVTTWVPRYPPDLNPAGPSHQLLPASQDSHGLGLPQLDPLRPSHAARQGTELDMTESFAQHSGHSGMNQPALPTMITNGDALPTQVATTSTGYGCAWLGKHARCGERFDTVSELVTHTAVAHDARGTAGRLLICQWDGERGPCLAGFRRDHFKRHLESHLGIKHLCGHCGKTYSRADSLKNHVDLHHPAQLTTH